MMNRFENNFSSNREARLKYGDADYQIVQTGDYVLCAVTGQRIPLTELRYWSVEHQEAYADAAAALKRYAGTD